MNVNSTGEASLRWVAAGAVSLVLHVVVLALFAWSGGDGSADAVRHPEPTPAPAEATSSQPQSTAEPVSAPEATAEPEPAVATARPGPKAQEPAKPRESPAVETYVVKKGDVLAHIAQDCDCTIQELAKLNGTSVKKLANLKVGQKIKVPKK